MILSISNVSKTFHICVCLRSFLLLPLAACFSFSITDVYASEDSTIVSNMDTNIALTGSVNAQIFAYVNLLTIEGEFGVRSTHTSSFLQRLTISTGYSSLRFKSDYPDIIPTVLRFHLIGESGFEVGCGLLYTTYSVSDSIHEGRHWDENTFYPTVLTGYCYQPATSHILFRVSLWMYTDSVIRTPYFTPAITFGYVF